METQIAKRVVGQEAVEPCPPRSAERAPASKTRTAPWARSCSGPTGVGKTSSPALAEFLFDDEHARISIDMSECIEKTRSPAYRRAPGYVAMKQGRAHGGRAPRLFR